MSYALGNERNGCKTVSKKAKPQVVQIESGVLDTLLHENEVLQENLLIANAYDNLGWKPMGGSNKTRGVDLAELQKWSVTNRALVGINPLIKKAVDVRVAYIFGEGITFGTEVDLQSLKPRERKFIEDHEEGLFSEEAYTQLEKALATDGQIFVLLSRENNSNKAVRVPLGEISDVALKVADAEKPLFIRRTWTQGRDGASQDTASDLRGGNTEQVHRWYPVVGANLSKADRKLTKINDDPVDHTQEMLYESVNKQVGWTWGLADLQPSVYWTKAYKEFLESQFVLVKSLAQYTWKVTAPSARGANTAAAKIAARPTMGPDGRLQNVGAAVPVTPGGDIAAINKAGANVNFDNGKALAALAIAGLGLSLHHVLPEKGEAGDETLDIPTLKTMTNRQKLYKAFFKKMFKFFRFEIPITFPPIQSEPMHRAMQAVTLATSLNALHPSEARQATLSILHPLGIVPEKVAPKAGAWAEYVAGDVNTNPGTPPLNPPVDKTTKGKSTKTGPLADGDHEMRPSEAQWSEFMGKMQIWVSEVLVPQK